MSRGPWRARIGRLTPQQRAYVAHFLRGQNYQEIAREFTVTPMAVNVALWRATRALGLTGREDLVAEAYRCGWITVHEERIG